MITPMNYEDEIFNEDFLADTLLKMGFDPEKSDFDQLKADMEPVLMDTIMVAVMEKLTPEQREKVDELFEEEKETEALDYIESIIPNYDDFLADVFEQFQKDRINDMR